MKEFISRDKKKNNTIRSKKSIILTNLIKYVIMYTDEGNFIQ